MIKPKNLEYFNENKIPNNFKIISFSSGSYWFDSFISRLSITNYVSGLYHATSNQKIIMSSSMVMDWT